MCVAPQRAYYAEEVNPTGRRSLVFNVRAANTGIPVRLPCGECIECRMDFCRQWAIRIEHERKMWRESAFLTLTYCDADLPEDGSLRKKDLQNFMKRLRLVRPAGVRFFACGEYGEATRRPHYHVALLNTFFPDMKRWKTSPSGEQLFVSAELKSLWKSGDCLIGELNSRSSAYVAGYVLKKHHCQFDYGSKEPEFRVMSRNPGVGFTYFAKFYGECYQHDNSIVDGVPTKLPRYYDTKFEAIDAPRLEELKRARRAEALSDRSELTFERRRVREAFEISKYRTFKKRAL